MAIIPQWEQIHVQDTQISLRNTTLRQVLTVQHLFQFNQVLYIHHVRQHIVVARCNKYIYTV